MIGAEEMRAVIEASIERDPNTGCWLWARGSSGDGYGSLGYAGWPRGAHRASWLAFRGNLPAQRLVMHICDTPACVNPGHLRIGTHADNRADCVAKGRAPPTRPNTIALLTHCRRGHPFDEDNTFIDARGDRGCIACRRERNYAGRVRRGLAKPKDPIMLEPISRAVTDAEPSGASDPSTGGGA